MIRCRFCSLLLLVLLAVLVTDRVWGQNTPVKIAPDELVAAFKKNAKATNQKYKGATIEVTGAVQHTAKSIVGSPYLDLEAGSRYITLRCYTTDKQPWAKYAPGQKVKVVGKWSDFAVIAQLDGCTVEAVDKNPARSATAEALTKECAADLRAANKKYVDTTVIVTGTIDEKQYVEASSFTHVWLKGAGTTRVLCRLLPAEKEVGKALKAGQELIVVGRFAAAADKEVTVDSGLVITPE